MENILALIAATAILVAIPGPNMALIVATSLRYGARHGLVTVAGTTLGVAVQLAFTVFGLTALIELAAGVLIWLKWLGVLYLLYLGWCAWREPVVEVECALPAPAPAFHMFWRGAGLALLNPKTLLFNAAFLPQFVAGPSHAGADLALLSCVFLVLLALGDSLWVFAANAGRKIFARYGRLRNKITGGLLTCAGIGLALARTETGR